MNRKRIRNAIVVVISALLGALLGSVVGNLLNRQLLSIAVGVLTGVPLGLAIATRRWQWVGVAAVADVLLLLLITGQWIALGLALIIAAATFFCSACALSEFYGGNELAALHDHLSLIFRGVSETHEIEGGKLIPPSKAKKKTGPRKIKIPPGNAVVLLRHRSSSKRLPHGIPDPIPPHLLDVQGPKVGECVASASERVIATFDLREKHNSYSLDMVQTSNGIAVTVRVAVTSCLDVREAARQGDIELSSLEKDHLRHLAMTVSDWEPIMKSALENSLRLAIGLVPAILLLSGQSYPMVERCVLSASNARLNPQGIRVSHVTIEGTQR
jgi:hypothetical protein